MTKYIDLDLFHHHMDLAMMDIMRGIDETKNEDQKESGRLLLVIFATLSHIISDSTIDPEMEKMIDKDKKP